jgi:AcrR family transcriptional regulator
MEPALRKKRNVAATSAPLKRVAKKRKLTRAEKADMIRNDLFHAAAKVVGEQGYLNAMILMITQKARVANGTFYNYFESRQDLFDQLLPGLGREMLQFIAERSATGANEFEREAQRFAAFFEYLRKYPEFYRILYEAEVFAPTAFDAHTAQVTKGYVGLLRKALNAGEITGYSSKEVDVLALILMGARYYIAMHFRRQEDGEVYLPEWVGATYKKFIMGGLRAIAEDE